MTPLKDFRDILYDEFGLRDDYNVFWRYAPDLFFKITTSTDFVGALNFGAEGRVYVLVKDYQKPWQDNGMYLKTLEYFEERVAKLENTDPYDVQIVRPWEPDSDQIDADMLVRSMNVQDKRTDTDIMMFAVKKLPPTTYFTTDYQMQARLIQALQRVCGFNLVHRLSVTTASFLCLANILGMKGEIISCPHKDIYFLETNTKSESTDLANMFASPASAATRGHTIKCKPRTKLKQKYNPALDFFVENKATTKTAKEDAASSSSNSSSTERMTGDGSTGASRRNSLDLYEEAATILGLTCSQTDDCKCIECQCHYFDFEEEMDFAPLTTSLPLGTAGGGEYYVDHNSSCAIQ